MGNNVFKIREDEGILCVLSRGGALSGVYGLRVDALHVKPAIPHYGT